MMGLGGCKKCDLNTIRNRKPERTLPCYLSIGEAEDYRSYCSLLPTGRPLKTPGESGNP